MKMETDTIDHEKKTLNNESPKETFMKLIQLHYKTSILAEKRSTIHLLEKISKQEIDELNFHLRLKQRPEYKITQKNGNDTIILEDQSIIREVISFSRIYDVLMVSHVLNDHDITDSLKANIEAEYVIPGICFDLIPKICKTCSKHVTTPRNGVVSFLNNMTKHGSTKLACDSILIYYDEYSEYIVLRPTRASDDVDVAMEIFKIFMEFGPPEKIYIIRKIALTSDLRNKLQILFPGCRVIIEPRYDEVFTISSLVMKGLLSWMFETKSESWEIGCSVVQNRLNHVMKPSTEHISFTAQDLFFNRVPFDSKIESTKSESEDEEELDKDIETLRISNTESDETDKESEATSSESVRSEDKDVDFGADIYTLRISDTESNKTYKESESSSSESVRSEDDS